MASQCPSKTNHGHTITTTFLIQNPRCPSFVSDIKDSLSHIDPKPISISASIISQCVVIQHDTTLSVGRISQALEAAGFDIEPLARNRQGDARPIDDKLNETNAHRPKYLAERTLKKLRLACEQYKEGKIENARKVTGM